MSNARKVAYLLVGLLVVATVVGAGFAIRPKDAPVFDPNYSIEPNATTTPKTTPTLDPEAGSLVFSDDFRESLAWYTGTSASQGKFLYTSQGYEIRGQGDYARFSYAPFERGIERLSASMTASQTADGPPGSGFGVLCQRGSGDNEITYEFFLRASGTWAIERSDGAISMDRGPRVLDEGSTTDVAGPMPVTVEGVCDTEDPAQARLALFVDGELVDVYHDEYEFGYELPADGWTAGVIASTQTSMETAVTITHFEERDLGTDPATASSVPTASPNPTATPRIDPSGGTTVYDIDFGSGEGLWPLGDLGSGATARIAGLGYSVTVDNESHHIVRAPWSTPISAVGVSARASHTPGGIQEGFAVFAREARGRPSSPMSSSSARTVPGASNGLRVQSISRSGMGLLVAV